MKLLDRLLSRYQAFVLKSDCCTLQNIQERWITDTNPAIAVSVWFQPVDCSWYGMYVLIEYFEWPFYTYYKRQLELRDCKVFFSVFFSYHRW